MSAEPRGLAWQVPVPALLSTHHWCGAKQRQTNDGHRDIHYVQQDRLLESESSERLASVAELFQPDGAHDVDVNRQSPVDVVAGILKQETRRAIPWWAVW